MDDIYIFLRNKKGSALKEQQLLHEAERWRDILINEGVEAQEKCRREQEEFEPDYYSRLLEDIAAEYPSLNALDMRRSVYQYVRTRNRMHYRELFRMIKAAIEAEERSRLLNESKS